MIKETRGRKRLPENLKKKPITLFLSNEEVKILGGEVQAKSLLQQYANYKIKQNERVNRKNIGVQQQGDDELLRRFEECDNKN